MKCSVKPGDLARTCDMGTSSGEIVIIMHVRIYSIPHRNVYDILMRGELVEGMDQSFLEELRGDD